MILCAPNAALVPRPPCSKPRAPGTGRLTGGALLLLPQLQRPSSPARLRRAPRATPSGGAGGPDPENNSNSARDQPQQQQQQEQEQQQEQLDAAASSPSASSAESADLGVEAVVDAVKAAGHGTSVVLLRLLDGTARVLPIFIGEVEASALSRALSAGRAAAAAASTAAAAAALGASPSASAASASASASSSPSGAAARPQTYDLLKSAVHAMGRTVAHVRVTDLKHNTYYACVSLAEAAANKAGATAAATTAAPPAASSSEPTAAADATTTAQQQQNPHLIELDARPSDALNLAVRCGCAVYVARPVAERCAQPEALLPPELQTTPPPPPAAAPNSSSSPSSQSRPHHHHQRSGSSSSSSSSALHHPPHHPSSSTGAAGGESHAEIVRTARAALAAYRDPTPMLALARDVAAAQERFEAAAEAQAALARCVTRDGALRLAAAVEAALADGRYAEAARLRDELLRAVEEAARQQASMEEEDDCEGEDGAGR